MDEYTDTAEYYTTDGTTAGNLADALAESGNAANVPSSSWADGLKSAFSGVQEVVNFGIKAAKDLGISASNAKASTVITDNRNAAAMVESKRAVQAAQAAPTFSRSSGFDLQGMLLPLMLLAGVVILARGAK